VPAVPAIAHAEILATRTGTFAEFPLSDSNIAPAVNVAVPSLAAKEVTATFLVCQQSPALRTAGGFCGALDLMHLGDTA